MTGFRNPLLLAFALLLYAGNAFALSWESPITAAMGSMLVPGTGQAINGDYGWGAVHLSAWLVMVGNYAVLSEKDDFISEEDAIDDDLQVQYTNRTSTNALVYERGVLFTRFYSSFAAYRDARQSNNSGYSTPAPKESFGELLIAPIRPDLLIRPGTFIPLILLAAYLNNNSDDIYPILRDSDISEDDALRARLLSNGLMDGISEECFFRGVLNSEFSDELGNGLGLLASSSIFGLMHSGAGNQATTLQAGVIGFWLGWLQQDNNFEISQSIALHFWINAISAYHEIKRGREVNLVSLGFTF